MAEEIENAAVNVPRAIVTTVLLNGSMGWAMVLAVLFCLGDIENVLVCVFPIRPHFFGTSINKIYDNMLTCLQNTPTRFPFIQVFKHGTGQAGATVMSIVIVVIIWCAVIGFAATASRMTWSFARDRGLPFHRHIRKVRPRDCLSFQAC
jgi:choline transport protein